VQGNAEQTAFRVVVHGQIDRGPHDGALDDVLDLACVFFEDEHVVGAEKSEADRRRQAGRGSSHPKSGIDDRWRSGWSWLRIGGCRGVPKSAKCERDSCDEAVEMYRSCGRVHMPPCWKSVQERYPRWRGKSAAGGGNSDREQIIRRLKLGGLRAR
jgi:hypothetical protein